MTREDDVAAFVKKHGPQWKGDLVRRLGAEIQSKTFLDRPLKKAREKKRLATFPDPPEGPHVIYFIPGTQLEALERWKTRLSYLPHGIHLKSLKVVGVARRLIPDLNEDRYYTLLLEADGTEPIISARSQIKVLDGNKPLHLQSGLWDYDDCTPPNPTELPFAVGETHGIDLFRVTRDLKLIRFPAQQSATGAGDWRYVEFALNRDYVIIVTCILDGDLQEPVVDTVGEIMDKAGHLVQDAETKVLQQHGTFATSGSAKITVVPIREESPSRKVD